VGGGGEGGVALSPLALSLSAPDLFAAFFVSGSLFNTGGTMTGKLPKGAGDFSVAFSRGVEFFEEAIFLGEAEFETSAARFDDWPNMSTAAVAVKNRAAAGSSMRIRRYLLILFLPPKDWALDW
jgi:hypothetical protein